MNQEKNQEKTKIGIKKEKNKNQGQKIKTNQK